MRLMRQSVMGLAAAVLIGAGAGAGGCKSPSDPATVGRSAFNHLAERTDGLLEVGMRKQDVLAMYGKANKAKVSQAKVGKALVEEWKIDAVTGKKDRWRSMTRYLYFANEALVKWQEQRWDYMQDDEFKARMSE